MTNIITFILKLFTVDVYIFSSSKEKQHKQKKEMIKFSI